MDLKNKIILMAAILALGVAGCNSKKPEDNAGADSKTSTSTSNDTKSTTDPKTDAKAGDTKTAKSDKPKSTIKSDMVDLGKKIRSKPDEAIADLKTKETAAPGNATISYMMASAYVNKKDWDNALAKIQEGNKAPSSSLPIKEKNFNEVFPGFSQMAFMAMEVKKNIKDMPADKAKSFITEMTTMAEKVMKTDPQCDVSMLNGMLVYYAAVGADKDLADKTKNAADVARTKSNSDLMKAWQKDMTKVIMGSRDMVDGIWKKHGLDPKEIQKPNYWQTASPEVKKKGDEAWTEIMAETSKLVDQVLAKKPAFKF